MKKFFLLPMLFFYCLQIAYTQSNQLDPSFGNKGIVKTDMGLPFEYNTFARQVLIHPDGSIYLILNATFISKRLPDGSIDSSYGLNGYSQSVSFGESYAALQPDGKIVVTGSSNNLSYVARINTNGMRDSSFGDNGIQGISFAPRSVAIQSNGKIVVAGGSEGFVVARYAADGSPDNTFNGNGQVLTDFAFKLAPDRVEEDSIEIHSGTANAIAIQADGKIVVGGAAAIATSNYTAFAIVRYKTNGTLDSTFDNDGLQITKIDSSNDIGYSLAIQKTDKKILLAGYSSDGMNNRFAVVRYNINGSLDNQFNGNGKQTADLGSDIQIANSVAIQSDGKSVVAGYTLNAGNNDFAIARFTANGRPDSTFDSDGILTTDFNNLSDDYAGSVAIQNDDKIVVAGYSYIYSPVTREHTAISRYNPDGSLDNSFDNDGKLEGDYKQGYTRFNATALQTDGKVVAAGQTWNGNNYDFAVTRFNIDGSPDNGFGVDGKQITDFGASEEAVSVAIQPGGKIVVAGNISDNNLSQFAVAVYNADGSPDNSFSGDGKLICSIGFSDVCQSVALQSDGKIAMAGFSYNSGNFDSSFFAIVRLNVNGTFDNTFSDDGKQLTDFGAAKDFASSVAIHDGKIIVSGRSHINEQDNFSLARYNTDGNLDITFSQDGKQNNVFGPEDYLGESLAIQNDGKIIVAGYNQLGFPTINSLSVARYKTNGDLDSTFGIDGFQTSYVRIGNSVAVNADGKIGVGGSYGNFALVLYKNDGNPDSSFSEDGIEITNVGSTGGSSIQGIVFAGDKLYAAGFGQFPGTLGVVARYLMPQGGPLPVSLMDFKAVLQNKSVLLQWQIATQQDLASFVIERSADGNKFLPINFVPAAKVNTFTSNYSITDKEPLEKINFYRLKILDIDGKYTYSNIVAIKINPDNKLQIFPNPALRNLFVQANGNNENAIIRIVDGTGRKLKEVKVFLNGKTSFSIDISNLSPGIYNLILHKNEKIEVQTFIRR